MAGLLIVGCGGFGHELLNYALDAGLEVRGFVDEDTSITGVPEHGAEVLGALEKVEFDPAWDRFVIAVGDTALRRSLASRVRRRGGKLASVIHPTAYVARDAVVGDGCVLCPFAMVATNARLAENVILNTYASAGHDARVAAHSVLSPYSTLNGNAKLGEAVFLGTHATVVPGRSVGNDAKVSAGSVVTRNINPGFLVCGNPARGRAVFAVDADRSSSQQGPP